MIKEQDNKKNNRVEKVPDLPSKITNIVNEIEKSIDGLDIICQLELREN